MTRDHKPSLNFSDTKTAFQHQSLADLGMSYFLLKSMNIPMLINFGPKLISKALDYTIPFTKTILKKSIYKQYCGGETLDEALVVAKKLADFGVKTILDFAIEASSDEASRDKCMQENIRAIEFSANKKEIEACVIKITGLADFSILEQLSAHQKISAEQKIFWQKTLDRLQTIVALAKKNNVKLYIDAEESWIQAAIDNLALDLMREFNKEKVIVFTTLQMYRHDRMQYLHALSSEAKHGGFKIGIKLVRGAYMEKEARRALELKYPTPIQASKAATDKAYNEAALFMLKQLEHFEFCLGTHNQHSTEILCQEILDLKINPHDSRIIFSQLFGMSDNLTFELAKKGFRAAKYLPYGPVQKVLPYLFRRAEENSSVKGQSTRELDLVSKEFKRRLNYKLGRPQLSQKV